MLVHTKYERHYEITIDSQLSFHAHLNTIVLKSNQKINTLAKFTLCVDILKKFINEYDFSNHNSVIVLSYGCVWPLCFS